MKNMIFGSDNDVTPLILRLTLGAVMMPHGLQKLMGWFGGHGFAGTMDYFTGVMEFPALVAFLVIAAESFGALGLIVGFMTRFCAIGIGMVMTGAIMMVHWKNGFFMNWFGAEGGHGIEYHILALTMAASVMVTGSGAWSVDRWLHRRLEAGVVRAPGLAGSAA